MLHRLSPWLMLSATLHATVGVIEKRAEPGIPATVATPLDFELVETPVIPALPPAVVPDEPARSAIPRPSPRAQQPAHKARAPREPAPSLPQARAPGEAPSAPSAPSGVAPRVPSLSPRAAALTLITPGDAPHDGQQDQVQTPVSAAQKLNEAILKGAAPPAAAPDEPVLYPGPKGGYLYSGKGFSATIATDGSVTMRDRYGSARIPLVPYRNERGKWRVGLALGGSFRLYEWLDRKFGKNDPYLSERRWFLERTRALRERLLREHAPELREQPGDAGT